VLAVDKQLLLIGIAALAVEAEVVQDGAELGLVRLDGRKLRHGVRQFRPRYRVEVGVAPERVELRKKAVFQLRQ